MANTSDLKERLKTAKEAVQAARDAQIQKKTEQESLQKQLNELEQQSRDEFGLEPNELEDHAEKLEAESIKLLEEVESVLGLSSEDS